MGEQSIPSQQRPEPKISEDTSNKVEIIIKDQETLSFLSNFFNKSKSKTIHLILISLISYAIGLGTIASAIYIDSLDRRHQSEVEQINLRIKRLSDEKDKKIWLFGEKGLFYFDKKNNFYWN
jgi:hypothetical protein